MVENASILDVNLAKNRGPKLFDRILSFSLTIGRILVILTETVALGAFLFRFGLDRQLVDLHDRIKQEQAILTLLKNNETTYRNLQDRLGLEGNIVKSSDATTKLVSDISGFIPSDMNLILLSFNPGNIRIEASLSSLISLSAFVKKLQAYSLVQRVSLDKLENRSSQGNITASLTIVLKPQRTEKL